MTVAEFKHIIACKVPDDATVQEIRVRVGCPIFVLRDGREVCLDVYADNRLVRELMEVFSNHSMYAYEEELRQGFLTIEGGHRVGIAGRVVLEHGNHGNRNRIRTIKDISGLNIRLAHEWKSCADTILPWIYENGEIQNTIFISPPGGGKTTILRDVIRQISDGNRFGSGRSVSVVDERSELGACFRGIPQCDLGRRTDIMDGCPKALGMLMMIRSMAPDVVAVDEIGTEEDLVALREVLKSGVRILATVHGETVEDLKKKPVLCEMVREEMFNRYIVLGRRPHPGTLMGVYDRKCSDILSGQNSAGSECENYLNAKEG